MSRSATDQMREPPSPEGQQRMVDEWNRANKPGARVRVTKDDGSTVDTYAITEAYVLGGHTAVIFLQGFSGGYSLARVVAL